MLFRSYLEAHGYRVAQVTLDLMQKKGFRFVTLEEAEGDPLYEGDPDVGSRYGGTLLELWMEAPRGSRFRR